MAASAQTRARRRASIVAALALAWSAAPGVAQTSPLIRVEVETSAGGATDVVARFVADQVGRANGPTMIVENKPGAGGVIGTEFVSRATPDGSTLLTAANPFVINPLMRKLNYDALTSFAPICIIATAPTVIAVRTSSPLKTLADLVAAARAKPGALTLASVGPGSPYQIGIETLKKTAGFEATFVPYPGNGPSLNALLGGQIDVMFGTYANVSEQMKAGALRLLAATTPQRSPLLPDLPTAAESGYPGFEIDAWFGALAPANTPAPIMADLIALYRAALNAPSFQARLQAIGLTPSSVCGGDFASFLARQSAEYRRALAQLNMIAD